jgi:ABC-type microcin C transport system duplicated ATPase subunit YejF
LRLSTIKDADLIYVLHQGHVVEQGTHRQLLAHGGHYATLCQAQTDAGTGSPHPRFSTALLNGTNGNSKQSPEGVSHA